MFCPNCGTKNDGVELPCKKCGFKLSGAAAPKFRGTMMLNAEQSVQELIDEHRRKQAEEGAPEAPAAVESGSGPDAGRPAPPRSGAPLFGMPGTPQAPLQPPRAGLPKRRMGTMMGVAPQVGGVQPPEDPPLASTPPAAPEAAAFGKDNGPVAGQTVPFEAVPAAPLPAAAPPAAEAAPDLASASAAPADRTPRRTEPLDSVAPPAPRRTEPLDSVAPPARRTEALDSVAPPARRTEALDSVAPPARRTEALDSVAPPAQRRRVRPLDVFLIVITLGLYGFVLLARQRPRRPSVD